MPNQIWRVATRKLFILAEAETIKDLRIPPGNRLEKLSRDQAGQFRLRINEQWRICFEYQHEPLSGGSTPFLLDYKPCLVLSTP
ncbi:MAG: type II toxin-antitoxin system RelE/ParE family toxin [Anaerolineales bacterium]